MNKRIAFVATGILMMSLTSCGSGGGSISKRLSESRLANMDNYKSIGVMNSKDLSKNKKSRVQRRDDGTEAGDTNVIVGENKQGVVEVLSFTDSNGTQSNQDGIDVREILNLNKYLIIDACLESGHQKSVEENGNTIYWTEHSSDESLLTRYYPAVSFDFVRPMSSKDSHHDCFLTTKDGFKMYSMMDLYKELVGGHKSACYFYDPVMLRSGTEKLILGFSGHCECGIGVSPGGVFELCADNEKLAVTKTISSEFLTNSCIDIRFCAVDDDGNFFSRYETAERGICMKSDGTSIDCGMIPEAFNTPVYCQNGHVAFTTSYECDETQSIGGIYIYENGTFTYRETESIGTSFRSLRRDTGRKYDYYFHEENGVRFYTKKGSLYKQTIFDEYTYDNHLLSERENGGEWLTINGNAYRFNSELSAITKFNFTNEEEEVFFDLKKDDKAITVSSIVIKNGYLYVTGTIGFDAVEWYVNDEGELVDEVTTRSPQITTYFYPIN